MEIRIESLNKDNTHSWVRISHGSDKFVMNLNNNEQEIPEVQLEEYALKLDVKDFACRSKAQSKTTKKRTCRLFHKNHTYRDRELGLMLNQGNIHFSDYDSIEEIDSSSSSWKTRTSRR